MKTDQTVDEYINLYSKDTKYTLAKIRKIGMQIIPDAEETISYGIPTFKLNGKAVMYYAGYKSHIGMYPIPKAPDSFNREIEPFIKGKGTVQFPLSKPIPYDLIEKFIRYSLETYKERNKKS